MSTATKGRFLRAPAGYRSGRAAVTAAVATPVAGGSSGEESAAPWALMALTLVDTAPRPGKMAARVTQNAATASSSSSTDSPLPAMAVKGSFVESQIVAGWATLTKIAAADPASTAVSTTRPTFGTTFCDNAAKSPSSPTNHPTP